MRKIKVAGETYVEVLLHVKTKNVRQIPKDLELVEDEQKIQLHEGMEFMTAFVPEAMLEGQL